jgi:hypothetical protein
MLWRCGSSWVRRVARAERLRSKDLGTLDGFRGGLILPRRVKAAPRHPLKDGCDCDLLIRHKINATRTLRFCQLWLPVGLEGAGAFQLDRAYPDLL